LRISGHIREKRREFNIELTRNEVKSAMIRSNHLERRT
jgi:hypothetical protein